MKYYYDLHIHSCLSPCSDDDMTPANIAAMCMIKGLNIAALTDHNTCKNCPAFFAAAQQFGITAVAGMELTTAEDVHIICLFPTLERAMEFDKYVEEHIIKIQNRTDIFGNQIIMDENDEVTGNVDYLLINATDISANDVPRIVSSFGGISYPAHIDRTSNGILAVLGFIPADADFTAAELNNADKLGTLCAQHPTLAYTNIITCSDAHTLSDINEAENYISLNTASAENLVKKLLTKK